jgi:hypothetical protein
VELRSSINRVHIHINKKIPHRLPARVCVDNWERAGVSNGEGGGGEASGNVWSMWELAFREIGVSLYCFSF